MSKDLDDFNAETDAFYKKVKSHMKSLRNFDKNNTERKRKAINEWFYGKVKAHKPLGKELYDDGKK